MASGRPPRPGCSHHDDPVEPEQPPPKPRTKLDKMPCDSDLNKERPKKVFHRRECSDPRELTDAQSDRCLTRAETDKLGKARESWCQIEGKPEQVWLRSTKRHYWNEYFDHVFDPCPVIEVEEDRAGWTRLVEPPKQHQRRHHFPGRRANYDHLCVYNIAKRRDEL